MSNFFHGKMFAKISELDETIQFDTADEFVVVNEHITQKITGQNLTESIVAIGNLASKAYVDAVVDGAPELLNTLNEIAAALNDDENFASHIISSIDTKLSTANFGLEFWSALEGVTTFHIAEDTNLYFTEQRVLDVLASLPPDYADRLISGDKIVILDEAGTLTVPSPTSEVFSLIFTESNYVATDLKPTLTLTDTPWELHGSYVYGPSGEISLLLDNIFPIIVNPGYESGDSFTFDSSVHGIVGHTLTIVLNDVVLPGGAGWTANIAASQPPVYPSTIKSFGAIKITANDNSFMFGTDGSLSLPVAPTSPEHAVTKDYVDSQLNAIEPDRLTSGSYQVVLQSDGTLTLPAEPTSAEHATTKGYVDGQIDNIIAGGGYATTGYVDTAVAGTSINVTGTADDFIGTASDIGSSGSSPNNPIFQTVTTGTLNVEDITFTGTGPVSFTSGNDIAFVAPGAITFNGERTISLALLQAVLATSTDFADFKARIAAL